jgi:hypothetical protein
MLMAGLVIIPEGTNNFLFTHHRLEKVKDLDELPV